MKFSGETPKTSLRKISVNYLCVSLFKYFEQAVTIAQRDHGILFISRFDSIFKPGGDAWICKDLFESHTQIQMIIAGKTTIWSWSLGDRSGINILRSETK